MTAFQNHILMKKKEKFKSEYKKIVIYRGISFSNVFTISFIYSFFYLIYIFFKSENINVTFSIYKIVFNYLKIHTNDIYYCLLFELSSVSLLYCIFEFCKQITVIASVC